jgi:hypothetical protein
VEAALSRLTTLPSTGVAWPCPLPPPHGTGERGCSWCRCRRDKTAVVLGSQVPIPAHDPNVLDVMSSEAAKVLGRAGLPRRRAAVASYRPEALTPCHTGAHAQCLQYRLQKSRVREKHDTVRDRLAEQPMTLVSAKEQRPWLSACGPPHKLDLFLRTGAASRSFIAA